MFKLVLLVLLVCTVHQSSQSASEDFDQFANLELALGNNGISLDDLLADASANDEDNYISQINPFEVMNPISNEPDLFWDARQMIESRGFKFEAHHVVTEDCYILEVHRIVNPNDKTPNKPPVLLQHGLIDSSTGFLFNSLGGHLNDEDDRNLGFALAKRGYDVWLGNYRGNTYSKNHTTFSTRDSDFWKFTFDNHAFQDLPAQIGYVQNVTNYDQIAYVGYSQGSLSMFNLLSMKPEVSKAIKPYIALAPVGHLGNMPSPIRYLAHSPLLMRALLNRNAEFLPNSQFSRTLSRIICRAFPNLICSNLVFLMTGFGKRQLNSTRIPVYFTHMPAGTSLANIIHFGLNVQSKRPQLLDYMKSDWNVECYGLVNPPRVPYEKINITDMYLLSAENDLLAAPKDIELLKKELKVKFTHKVVGLKEFGHMDFVMSQKSDRYVNDFIIKVIKNKTPSMKVDAGKRLRLRTFEENTCYLPRRNRRCHLDLKSALGRIIK